MKREFHVRFCERWRGKLPLPTRLIGKKLRARTEESREVETILGCQILNRFLELGRCESKLVA